MASERDEPALFMTVRCEIAQSRRETGAWSREGGRRTREYIDRLSREPARLHAAEAACRLVAAANGGYPLLCAMRRVDSRNVHE